MCPCVLFLLNCGYFTVYRCLEEYISDIANKFFFSNSPPYLINEWGNSETQKGYQYKNRLYAHQVKYTHKKCYKKYKINFPYYTENRKNMAKHKFCGYSFDRVDHKK